MRSRKRMLGVILTVLAAGLVLVAVAWAQSSSQTASAGGVSATFTYSGSGITVTNPRLRIVRAGQTAYEEPVHAALCGSICGPGALGAHAHSVRVIRLEPSGAPDVILELFSGGANCCFIDQVFTYSPITHGYLKTERNFGSFGVTVKRIGKAKHWRFVSADENFKYEFTDGAASGEPIQIWSFSGRRFHDVTRHYPNLIATDAKRWLHFFKQNLSNGVGLIAAWAADEELLGQDKLVQSTLATEARQGDLRDGATGQRFITKLNRFLHQFGYRH